ncbi:DUF1672 family protein [Sporosarcina sp. Marseille-Q4063]|uniref:DUF1672 family protein n=1 Tax=Sporosarcina sp. Marseille-Q4063 TaxID=2810514 RepID=UPI001BB0B33C|nr:DUF1672 family protein [Sporosarcina sp. Marseille-Q4063]QUW23684.1 DUF1672 family protein [Sporosarcina sp. Marseille-Q4063]
MKLKTFILLIVGISFLLVGCNTRDLDSGNAYETKNFVRIQEYGGVGYTLRGSRKETGEIAEENRAQVEQAVQNFFMKNYKTDVIIHNFVSAADGVSVFVESVGEPHFYTFAIVPVDVKNKEINIDSVWSQEGQVENAIKGGLYAMAFDEEFTKLNQYLENLTLEYPVVGTPIKAIENVMGTGFSTPYYFITPFGDVFKELFETYINSPELTRKELKIFFEENNNYDPDNVAVGIEFYMKDANTEPDEVIHEKVITEIREMQGIPKGSYSVMLNDNLIDPKSGIGAKENTLGHFSPERIIKE